ncbi:Protein of unknown function (DUF751) family protein [Synechococcus sp. CC9311]|nr:Protein of unknown function (DUF751) family protein [Synechococcus sp. CC9311]
MTVFALSRQSSYQIHIPARTMREFFVNVTRYPRYLIAFGLGVLNSVAKPLLQRLSNPVTAVALIGALISGLITLGLVLRAMVTTTAPLS